MKHKLENLKAEITLKLNKMLKKTIELGLTKQNCIFFIKADGNIASNFYISLV